jgi:RHS repeat-associated protein
VSYTYDANGRLSTVTDPENHVTSYSWDANNRMTGVRPPNLQGTQTNLVTNEYTTAADAPTPVGWVKKQTFVDGGVYQFAYNVTNGKSTQTHVTDPRGYVRRVTFNPDGYTLEDRRALNQTEEQFDSSDRPIQGNFVTSHTNASGDMTTTEYDGLGRVKKMTRLPGTADEAITTYTYDPVWISEIVTITDPLNHTTTLSYDERGNRESVTDALNHTTTFAYNLAGQVTSVTDPLQHTTTFDYAGPDVEKITDPLGRVTQRFFDAGGRMLSETDPAGETTRFAYNKLNQVVQVTDAVGGITTYGYDIAGRLASVTDALTHATTYGYDTFDRLTSRTDPLSKTESFMYDLNGNPSQRTDRKGQVTTRTYDALDRLHQITYADNSTITYTYDSGNRLTAIADSVGGPPITRDYDDLDRLILETTAQGTVSYTYDKADRRATMTVAGQPTVTYGYDDANRLTTVTQGLATVTLTYDDADRRSSVTLPNGIVTVYGYDNASQLTALTYTLGQTPLGNLLYVHDAAGRRQQTEGSFARTGLPQSVASATYDASNRLLEWGGRLLSYDAAGNLASDGSTSYSWSARGQLVSIAGGYSVAFAYDALARRKSETVGSDVRSFLYDGFDVAAELSNAAVSATILPGASVDERFARTHSGGTQWFVADGAESVVALADSAGVMTAQYAYEPFGRTTSQGNASTNTFSYTGREQVSASESLLYYRARFYSAMYQRFISEDPIEFEGGLNLYAYVHNDPISFTDPYGTCECSIDVKCRPVHGIARVTGAAHCYFVVMGRDQRKVTLTAGPTDGPTGQLLKAWPEPWVNGRDVAMHNKPSDTTVYHSRGASQTCNDVDCLNAALPKFVELGLRYRARGPNSNTYIMWSSKQCGLSVVLPGNAYGAGARVQ